MARPLDRKLVIASVNAWRVAMDRPPKHLPLGYWQSIADGDNAVRVIALVTSLLWLICVSGQVLLLYAVITSRNLGLFPYIFICFVLPFLGMAFFGRAVRRLHRQFTQALVQSGGQLCLKCGYCLLGSTDETRCAECGEPIDHDAIVQEWQQWFPNEFDAIFDRRSLADSTIEASEPTETPRITKRVGLFAVVLRRRPRGVPPGLWQQVISGNSGLSSAVQILAYVTVFIGVVCCGAVSVGILEGMGTRVNYYALEILMFGGFAGLLTLVAFYVAQGALQQRALDAIREADYERCLACFSSDVAKGKCEACGAAFDKTHAMKQWRSALPELRTKQD